MQDGIANAGSAIAIGVGFSSHSRLSFPKNPSEGNNYGLMDGYAENAVCSRRPLQEGKQAVESRSGAFGAGTFRRTGQETSHWGSSVTRHACTDDAGRQLEESTRPRHAKAAPPHVVSASCDPATDVAWNCDSSRSIPKESGKDAFRSARSRGPDTLCGCCR